MLARIGSARRALTTLTRPVPRESVTVRVPATSANMGPGYDCLGIALTEYNTLTIERSDDPTFHITGEGAESLPYDQTNYYYRAFELGFKASASPNTHVPSVSVECDNGIPPARGLGSSSACLAAGVSAGFALNGYDPEDAATRLRVYQICAEQEGHPDNVAPAIYGGLQLSFRPDEKSKWLAQRIPCKGGISAVLFVPDFELPTKEARALLADTIPRSDAVYNISRAAMLIHAFSSGRLDLLRWGTQDRLHQPQRGTLFPLFEVINAATSAGAHGAWLSGAGPTVCALVGGDVARDDNEVDVRAGDAIGHMVADGVAESMRDAAERAGMEGRIAILPVADDGVVLLNGGFAEID